MVIDLNYKFARERYYKFDDDIKDYVLVHSEKIIEDFENLISKVNIYRKNNSDKIFGYISFEKVGDDYILTDDLLFYEKIISIDSIIDYYVFYEFMLYDLKIKE